jgi:hypothetical protein
VYNTQNYWVFGFSLLPGILDIRKYNVSETGSISVLNQVWGQLPAQSGPLERTTDPVIEVSSF